MSDKKDLKEIDKDNKIEMIKKLINLLEQVEDSLDRACNLYPKNKAMTFNIIGSQTQAIDDYFQVLAKEVTDPELKKLLSKIKKKSNSNNSNIYS